MQRSYRRPFAQRFAGHSATLLVAGLFLCLLVYSPHTQAAPRVRSTIPQLTLLSAVGTLNRDVADSEIARWRHELRRANLPNAKAARLRIWLGEVEIARNREPERAIEQFNRAQRIVSRTNPIYGRAAFDRAITLFYHGAYALAAREFRALLHSQSSPAGYNLNECALWYRHAAACAGYHAQHARLGITEPPSLDPMCGVASLAACMRSHSRPYDKKTLLAHCRMTGLGNNMQDLLQCAKRLGLSAWTVKADDEGLKLLPKPLVAYVEQDHFVAVTRADKDGVSYLCSDCGAWPGGRRDLTWKQWRAMDCNLYLAVAVHGSAEERMMTAALAPHPAGKIASATSRARLAAFPTASLVPRNVAVVRTLSAHIVLLEGLIVACGQPPTGQQCKSCPCAQDSPPPSGHPNPNGNGPPHLPGFDPASSTPSGPASGDPVDLATGEEKYDPPADLTVYNPIGPSVVWQRHYGSLRGLYQVPSGLFPYPQYALGGCWNSLYDLQVIVANGMATLYYPDGSNYVFSAPTAPTQTDPQVACPAVTAGVPMLCTWNYNSDGSNSFVFTLTDHTQWTFSSLTGYAITRMTDRNGNFINFVYSTSGGPGYALTAITDSNNLPLLTIHRLSVHDNVTSSITSVSDRYGRSVYYTLQQFRQYVYPSICPELTQVSQIVRTGSLVHPSRYTYGYILHSNGEVDEPAIALHTITAPSPTGKGTATATINYNGPYVGSLTDANGNTRTYTPIDTNDTQVTVTDRTGKVVTSYTVGFDAQLRPTYRTDGTNQTQVYQATYHADNAYQPYQVTNGNNQTTTYTYDPFGQILTKTSPRNVATNYTRDYTVFPLGELTQIQEGSKSPTTLSYYEPSGLIQTIAIPLPGTSGSTQTATVTFTYDALGNVLTVQRPGNDTTATITTTLNYMQDGAYSQPDAIGQPLTVTDNLGHVTHFRYDAQGNRVTTMDALGNRTDSQYNIANQLTETFAPAVGDITNLIGVNRSSLTYQSATKSYVGTITLTNSSSHTIQGYLLAVLTNLAPGVTLANAAGTYVNSPALLSSQVSLGAGAHITLKVSFSASSASAVNYGVQTYLTDSQGNPLAQRSVTQSLYLYPGGPLRTVNTYGETGALYRQVNYSHGKEGELLSVSGSTEPVSYTYDANYRLQTLTDGNGHATQYAYNTAGWLQSVTYPMGDNVQYPSYDPMGNLLKRIDGRGIETDYTYNDPESKLTNVAYVNNANYPNVSQYNVTIGYDGYGRQQDVYDYSGHSHFDYDDLNLQTEIDTTYSDASGNALPTVMLTYGFYPDGSRQSMSVQTNTTSYDWSYHYDSAGRPLSLTSPFSEVTQWTYLANNWLASQIYGNGVIAQYAYNRRGFLNDLTHYTTGTTPLSDFGAMVYDAVGNRLTKVVTIPGAPNGYSGQTAYGYDFKNQLLQEQTTLITGSGSYAYDVAGNPTSFNGASHSFNVDNQFTDAGFAYDGNGNPTTYDGTALTFDPENHMAAFGTVLTAGYRFDGLRAWKQNSNGRTYYIYDSFTPICELDGKGNVTAVNTFAVNGLLSRHTSTSTGSIFYDFDPQGSVAQHLDSSGSPLSTNASDAFGVGTSTSLAHDPVSYNGQWSYVVDSETGLLLLGHRYYDSTLGRFVTRDPMEYRGGVNLYSYVRNGVTYAIDPQGFQWSTCEIVVTTVTGLASVSVCAYTGFGAYTCVLYFVPIVAVLTDILCHQCQPYTVPNPWD